MVKAWHSIVLVTVIACGDNSTPAPRVVGQMWSDDNHDGIRDPGEPALAGFTVYVDLDLDGSLTEGEPTARTDGDGTYEVIVPEDVREYIVEQLVPFGFRSGLVTGKPRRAIGVSPIIGGRDASPDEFGFMVAVGAKFDDFVFPFCGGVLISERHVLTAAHCSEGEDPADAAVVAGTLDQFDGQNFDVASITIHPEFDSDTEHGYDLALWTLAEPIDLAAAGLTTVEMLGPKTDSKAKAGALATTIGWGVSDRQTNLLQTVHLPLVSEARCAETYPDATNFETQICAGAPEGGIDSCQGDSGGPLLVRDDARQVWLHAGITSYGDGCALRDTPGVYARVSALSDWVIAQTPEKGGRQKVTVDVTGTADFPTRATTRPQIGEIDARWQLTAIALPETVPINTPIDVSWAIVGDKDATSGFTCELDPDGAGTLVAQTVACGPGTTTVQLAGFPTGIFPAELTVTRTDVAFSRRVNVFAGTPASVDTQGALTAQDLLDVDYQDPFRVDYYDVTGLAGTRAFAVEVQSAAFDEFLTLYDADLRNFTTGGGILEFGTQVGNKQRVVVTPEPGRRYLIGVSSFGPNELGNYTVSIINDGTLTVR